MRDRITECRFCKLTMEELPQTVKLKQRADAALKPPKGRISPMLYHCPKCGLMYYVGR
jgi:hypothetical protein